MSVCHMFQFDTAQWSNKYSVISNAICGTQVWMCDIHPESVDSKLLTEKMCFNCRWSNPNLTYDMGIFHIQWIDKTNV